MMDSNDRSAESSLLRVITSDEQQCVAIYGPTQKGTLPPATNVRTSLHKVLIITAGLGRVIVMPIVSLGQHAREPVLLTLGEHPSGGK